MSEDIQTTFSSLSFPSYAFTCSVNGRFLSLCKNYEQVDLSGKKTSTERI